jgi:uracil phosphoribosyltransferase
LLNNFKRDTLFMTPQAQASVVLANPLLIVLQQHPVVAHALSFIRNKETNSAVFRTAMRQVGNVLLSRASEQIPLVPVSIETPICTTTAYQRDPNIPILVVPILRAGLVWADLSLEWLPEAHLYHLGLARNEETLQPISYYNKLPKTTTSKSFDYPPARAFVIDPMLATGGSAVAAIEALKQRGVLEQNITFICLIASPEGLKVLQDAFPTLTIVAAAVDDCLNEHGYIVPGLGDAGDRVFGTL